MTKPKLTAKYDAIFKAIMQENKEILIRILETILEKEIEDIVYLNPELIKKNVKEKTKILDLYLKTKDDYIDVEANSNYNAYIKRRNLIYGFQLCSRLIPSGTDYKDIKGIKMINLNYNKKGEEAIIKNYLRDDRGNILDKMLLYCEIYIDNLLEKYYNNDEEYITKYKYLMMLGLDYEELSELAKEDEIVKKYREELKKVTKTIYLEPLISEENDRIMTFECMKDEAREEGRLKGIEEGKIEGIQQGIEQGIQQGIEQGIEQGKLSKQKEMAKQMLKDKVDIDLISKYTGLTIKEIKKI